MAENEYLDSSKSRRWLAVVKGISNGVGVAELEAIVLDCFFKTLRSIRRNHPLADLICSIESPQRMDLVIEKFGRTTDVTELLKESTLSHTGTLNILEGFLQQAVDQVFYDLPYLASTGDSIVNISEIRRQLDAIRPGIKPEIQRIARKLADKPNWNPQRQKKEKLSTPKRDVTKAMLTESLLAGIRK